MRVPADVTKTVAFIGTLEGNEHFQARATGFFVIWKSDCYFVTARHVAVGLLDQPFGIRINRLDGGSAVERMDPVMDETVWRLHPDETVDLAVLPIPGADWIRNYDLVAVPSSMFTSEDVDDGPHIGLADLCYAVGLFQLVTGARRNLPVVHSGHIALMPGTERIPVHDKHGPPKMVEGYLVELQNLKGLSGAPVFVRPMIGMPNQVMDSGKRRSLIVAGDSLMLLGVWSASWDGPSVAEMGLREGLRVPVGMGTVCPSAKLAELLDLPELDASRAVRSGRASG